MPGRAFRTAACILLAATIFAVGQGISPTGSARPNGAAGGSLAGTYPNPTIGTLAQNLLFTDATYDIGASLANRPNNLWLAGGITLDQTIFHRTGGYRIQTGSFINPSTGTFAWTSTSNAAATVDVAFNRVSAGVVGVGTSQSAGVGGSLVATNLGANPVAVASLTSCAAGTKGYRATVTDSNAASFTAGIGAVVAAGGSTVAPVFCDGTNWRIG